MIPAKHYFLITESTFKDAALQELLEKIIRAVGLDPNKDVSIQAIPEGTCIEFITGPESLGNKIILFGAQAFQYALQFKPKTHKIYRIGFVDILCADSLDHYQKETQKKLLWQALKEMYPSV